MLAANLKLLDTVHDMNYKIFEKFQLTCDRNDPSYRNWIMGRLRKVARDEEMIQDIADDKFLDQYFVNFDLEQNSSKQKVIEMSKPKSLLGPGYYNVNHSSSEKAQQCFRFDRESNNLFS